MLVNGKKVYSPSFLVQPEDVISLSTRVEKMEAFLKDVIEKRFGLKSSKIYTLDELGILHNGISRERVRQIEARLLQKIRDHLFKEIKDFSKDWIQR